MNQNTLPVLEIKPTTSASPYTPKMELAQLFRLALLEMPVSDADLEDADGDVDEARKLAFQARVIQYVHHEHEAERVSGSYNPVQANLRISNIIRELMAPEMTFHVFSKGMSILDRIIILQVKPPHVPTAG